MQQALRFWSGKGTSTNLLRICVTFHYKQIASAHRIALLVLWHFLDLHDVGEIDSSALHVSDTKIATWLTLRFPRWA